MAGPHHSSDSFHTSDPNDVRARYSVIGLRRRSPLIVPDPKVCFLLSTARALPLRDDDTNL